MYAAEEYFSIKKRQSFAFLCLEVECCAAALDAENLTDWNIGDGGFKWRTNCYFYRDDIGQIPLTEAQGKECGRLCISNPQCSHFSFGYLNNCYMQKAPLTKSRQDVNYGITTICGIIPWRFGSEPAKDDWKNDNSSGAQNCGFYGNDSLILTTECRQAKDCSYWYEQVLPTNGSTSCKLVDGSSGSCCPENPKLTDKKSNLLSCSILLNEL
ncbi:uncharacterized protein LOC124337722 [Daphnia pulicaria]|uniref:uncharacterized protein LOC124337722 n=1 Tax=Daphnia pulicaria TaxID=35523 RepID=UPI001EEC677D|nr:uncharacterized protein LOC124337722 [Daphnia pulicaria]